METDKNANRAEGIRLEEEWVPPFRRALALHGRLSDKQKWHIVWARRFAKWMRGGTLREATRKDVEEFLATLSTPPVLPHGRRTRLRTP